MHHQQSLCQWQVFLGGRGTFCVPPLSIYLNFFFTVDTSTIEFLFQLISRTLSTVVTQRRPSLFRPPQAIFLNPPWLWAYLIHCLPNRLEYRECQYNLGTLHYDKIATLIVLREPLKRWDSEQARVHTGSSCPLMVWWRSSVLTFHTLIVVSEEPEKRYSLQQKLM